MNRDKKSIFFDLANIYPKEIRFIEEIKTYHMDSLTCLLALN